MKHEFEVTIPEGKELKDGYVEMRHNTRYSLLLKNHQCVRCDAEILIDGIHVGTWRIEVKGEIQIERPVHDTGHFTFFEVGTEEARIAGISKNSDNGLVSVTFKPERIHVSHGLNSSSLPGATGLTGESGQRFVNAEQIEHDMSRAFTIHLRLVSARQDIRPLAPRSTPIPPPINWQWMAKMNNTPMKTRAVTWMVALALSGVCMGQQTEDEKRFYADYARSEQQAVAAFPDVANAATPLAKRVAEMDKALAADEDPLYNSADKPLILTRRAAKELGIKPLEAKPIPTPEPQAPVKLDGKVIPELNGYTAVTIRSVEPDGLRIIHESGAAKIPIEKLTDEQRAQYGISAEGAAQYRKQVAENTATSFARQQEAAREQAATPRPSAAAPAAKFITADQVKAVWVKKLPQPRSLDPNYSKIIKSYREFVGEIRAGKRDLDAQETAATYNKAKAIEIGNNELVATYEAELGRISEAKNAAEALAQQQEQARRDAGERARLNAELMSIDRNLRDIRNTIQGW